MFEEPVVKRDVIMVIAYAERIECFVQYLKTQEPGNAVTIKTADQPTQSHYSVNMVVNPSGDELPETVEIIYVKYQDGLNPGFNNLNVVDDVTYAFIGGDLYDKEEVRQFLVNCGVPPNNTFVAPCAYNIEAGSETDCQKRKFKKSIKQQMFKAFSQSEEKTPITQDKNKFGYNVDLFNAVVRNNETKQCTGRPFILLQFPLLICWLFKYSQVDLQSANAIMSSKIIDMFKASSGISSSLLQSLRIPAAQMFADRASFNTIQPITSNTDAILDKIAEATQQQSASPQTFTEIKIGSTSVQAEKTGEQPSPSVQAQTGGELVGFDSNTNKNNCYLNALFQMLCRIKGLKEEMVSALVQNAIPQTRVNSSGTNSPNPEYEIANIFQKYNQSCLDAETSQKSQTVFLETEDVIGVKTFALNEVDAVKDEQQSITDFLNKQTFCQNENCSFDKYLYFNEGAGQYYFALSDQTADTFSIPDNIPVDDQKQTVIAQQKPYLIFYFERVSMVQNVLTKSSTKVTADGGINMDELKYVKKGAIVHFGDSARSGHYVYISYKQLEQGYVIDKMYNNSNVIAFNNDGSRFLAQHAPNQIIVDFFANAMAALIDRINLDENANKLANKNEIIQNFTDAAFEIASSDILKLAQYEDIKTCFDGIDAQINDDINNLSAMGGTKQTIVDYFSHTPYTEILKKNIADIEEDVARNAVFFLYERVDQPAPVNTLVGGTNKKKAWTRSHRARKTSNQARVSLKRLNKMKQGHHPSIKKRSSSLKK